jgi:hypothetical protein
MFYVCRCYALPQEGVLTAHSGGPASRPRPELTYIGYIGYWISDTSFLRSQPFPSTPAVRICPRTSHPHTSSLGGPCQLASWRPVCAHKTHTAPGSARHRRQLLSEGVPVKSTRCMKLRWSQQLAAHSHPCFAACSQAGSRCLWISRPSRLPGDGILSTWQPLRR